MPYAMWTFWFLAGGLVTVSLVLLAPSSQGEWIAAGARRRANGGTPALGDDACVRD